MLETPSAMTTTVLPTGQQRGTERYGPRLEGSPYIAHWRCNLTGLSQVHDLYFIAYGADIHVYEPQFPTQKLTTNAKLIFTSQPSSSQLRGYIDPRRPHNINNLVIAFLGNEEVVAAVRDDGDVDAFYVRHVVQAIERRADSSNTLSSRATEMRPFFQTNVGISVWGLAIHTQPRILATSSNAFEVRVFKFGLAQADDEGGSPSRSQQDPSNTSHSTDIDGRHSDVTHHIINGESNIPYISFCNTGDDPEGRWLITTDMSGVCRVMDLHELNVVQVFRFGRLVRDPSWHGFDRINAGWVLMFLDRRSFHETEDVYHALGLGEQDSFSDLKRNPNVWDLTKTVHRLPGYRQPFVYHTKKDDKRRMMGDSSLLHEPAEQTMSEADEYDASTDNESDGGAPLGLEGHTLDESVDSATLSAVSTTTSNTSDHSSINIIDDAEDPDDEMTEDTISFTDWYNGDTISFNTPHYLTSEPICDHLPCPILHTSCRNIYLVQPSSPTGLPGDTIPPGPSDPPLLGLANPLRQNIQSDFEYLTQHQRLNMAVSIPPLGVVIVASQKGRAIVLSLSKLPATTTYPKEMLTKPVPSWLEKTTYTMRVECILPLPEQEKDNLRPFMPLHGIAASPLQGCGSDAEGKGRWRFMMMYQDHSVLSYEISRSRGVGGKAEVKGFGVGLESVVV